MIFICCSVSGSDTLFLYREISIKTNSSRYLKRILTNYKHTKVQTKQATTYAAGIFHKYCILRNGYNNAYVIDTLAANTLDSLLESFYAEA